MAPSVMNHHAHKEDGIFSFQRNYIIPFKIMIFPLSFFSLTLRYYSPTLLSVCLQYGSRVSPRDQSTTSCLVLSRPHLTSTRCSTASRPIWTPTNRPHEQPTSRQGCTTTKPRRYPDFASFFVRRIARVEPNCPPWSTVSLSGAASVRFFRRPVARLRRHQGLDSTGHGYG